MSGSGVIAVNVELRVGALEETVTVTGESPIVDTQSVRREVVLNNETLSTLPATRGYGSALAAVPALNIGGVAGAGATTAPTTPAMMFFTAHGGASGEGRVMTNGLTVAAPFGGGGVSDVTYDTANAEEMQVLISGGLGEAETGGPSINIVPKSGGNEFRGSAFYSTSGDWATSNNVDDRAAQPSASRSRRPCGPTGMRASASAARSSAIACGSSPTCAAGPTPSVVDGIFANRFAGDASHWDYVARSRRSNRAWPKARKIYRRSPDRAGHAAEPRDVLARLSAPLRRIVAAEKAATAAVRRAATGSRPGERSAPIPCRRKRSPAITTSRTTPRRRPTRRRSAAAR